MDEPQLLEVADGVHAYLQPAGTWGWSNAGLLVGDAASLLVDTLFDLDLTRRMLDAMAALTGTRPIETVVNTHANGDHCYGNQLLAGDGVEIVASAAAARELEEVTPALLDLLVTASVGTPLEAFVQHAFGRFTFAGIEVPPVTTTFTGRHEVVAGERRGELIQVGPAHTAGDVIAWLPDERVVFTGDILFIGGTPIMWAGPIGNWIAACELIESLDPAVIVPGHGPLTDLAGVRAVAAYLRTVRDGIAARHAAGFGLETAVADLDAELDRSPYAGWTDRERLIVTAHQVWAELEPAHEVPDALGLMGAMAAAYTARHGC